MLRLIAGLYGAGATVRNRLYDRGILRSYSLGARTISIGNITAGGTGKTPLVAHVAALLAEAGEKVCVLTRGYGRRSSGRVLVSDGSNVLVDADTGGDEPVELARKLIGKAVVVADADRVAASAWAKEKFGTTVFVLDDGFQHRRAQRDLDIICIDATDPLGGGHLLPAGRLREPFANIVRADAIVITRSDLVDSIDSVVERLRKRNGRAQIFSASSRITKLTLLEDFLAGRDTNEDRDDRQFIAGAFAFCGLGSPEGFRAQLAAEHFGITGLRAFGDHHRFDQSDVASIEAEARSKGSRGLLTTAKDALKLEGLKFTLPCFVVEIELKINDADGFRRLITASS